MQAEWQMDKEAKLIETLEWLEKSKSEPTCGAKDAPRDTALTEGAANLAVFGAWASPKDQRSSKNLDLRSK